MAGPEKSCLLNTAGALFDVLIEHKAGRATAKRQEKK
jgi:hypothetical protein